MFVTGKDLSPGPTIVSPEKGVHIMRLFIVTPGGPGGAAAGAPAPAGGPPVAQNIGAPSPTDILVFDHQPFHSVGGQMKSHPQVHIDHPETILHLSVGNQEKVVWWSEEQFAILEVNPSHHDPNPGPYPFEVKPQTEESRDLNGRKIFISRSTVPKDAAINHRYKIKFSTAGEIIDPDMSCGP
jgi:hypothetical protein